MPVYKLQSAFWRDSVLPRDAFVITPHFQTTAGVSDPDALCEDLATAYAGWLGGTGTRVVVTAYDAQGTKPVYPVGTAERNPTGGASSSIPREVALCLSFYSQRNIPRQRGRLYVPGPLLTGVADVRPTATIMQKAADLAPIFQQLGGADVDWVIYSKLQNVARPVTNWWVDDEWDTIRSRGLRSTTRLAGVTSEL